MKTKLLILGGSGLVGTRFIELNKDKFEIISPQATDVNILDKDQLIKAFEENNPEIVVNFAAFTNVQGAEKEKDNEDGMCFKLNAIGAKNIAEVCKNKAKQLIHISTDYVFDGSKGESFYSEEDIPNPINWYGETKYIGEKNILASGCKFTIIRISMPYSAKYKIKLDVARFFIKQLMNKKTVYAIEDQYITPTLTDDIAKALGLIIKEKSLGIYHIASVDDTTPFKFAQMLAENFNLNSSLIKPIKLDDYNKKKLAPLLKFSRLDTSKFVSEFGNGILHTIEKSVKLFKEAFDENSINQI